MTIVRPWHSWSRNQHPENLTPIENLARADTKGHESRQTKVISTQGSYVNEKYANFIQKQKKEKYQQTIDDNYNFIININFF